MSKTHFRTCHLCETMCGIAVEYEGDKILSIKGDPNDVLSKGNICPKATGLQDVHTDPDRLKAPIRKINGEWQEVSWEEAFEFTAEKIVSTQKEHGNNSVASYMGRSIAHNLGSLIGIAPLREMLKTENIFTGSTVDQIPHNYAWQFMLGHPYFATVPDIDRTHYFLMLGTNPKISNGAMMSTGANPQKKFKEINARGGKTVLIDPRRNESAEYVDEHHFIKPNTDALFLIGIINTIFEKGLDTPGRLEAHIKGWEKVQPALKQFDMATIEKVTGIAAEDIQRIAVELATAESAICYGRTGLSMVEFGGLCNWLMQVVNIITGNMDEPGGLMFPLNAIDTVGLQAKQGQSSYDAFRSRVSQRPEFAGELPLCVMAEEIMTPGEGKIRGLIALSGNPVLSMANGKLLEEAFDQLDFMISVDFYLTETTKHADIILPPVGPFEKSHYDLFYHTYDTINWSKYSPRLYKPEGKGYTDYEIIKEVLKRVAAKRATGFKEKLQVKAISKLVDLALTPDRIVALGLRFGPYGPGLNPFKDGLTLKKLKKNPGGVYLGPLQRSLPERIFTKDKKIDLAPDFYLNDLPRLYDRFYGGVQEQMDRNSEFDMTIISRLTNRTLGWMHNSERLVKGKHACTLMIHPDDAEKRGVNQNSTVTVSSAVGSIEVPVEITDTIMPGVVCLPHAWGHTRKGTRKRVAEAHPGASLNDITNEKVVDELTSNAVVHGVPVKVELSRMAVAS
ncbi:molybdopterin-dependent oxidoreductase [Endozoicomonas arenosclerae]|uniref:molybdopterin-dependent oxidoreductase n=1 Tax=Endozoicomonas arenosclerae TaxID=1633495 RepID=UPI0007867D74|nr:molybdopterin-dependent oxidoreductase [Endozoicomonas arenosclerae]